MAAIHVLLPDRSLTVFEDFEIPDLLREGQLTPDNYFWKEGMPDWRPLSELPHGRQGFIPEPRKSGRLPKWPSAPVVEIPVSTKPIPGVIAPKKSPRPLKHAYRLKYASEPWAMFSLAFLLAAAGVAGMNLWIDHSYANGAVFLDSRAYLSAKELMLLALGGLTLLAHLAFFIWLYRASSNSRRLSPEIEYEPEMAVGYFFIPILGLFKPYQVVQEIWKISTDPRGWYGRRESFLVICWWVFWLLFWTSVAGYWVLVSHALDHKSFDQTMTFLQLIDLNAILSLLTTATIVLVITWRHKKLSRPA